MAGDLPHTQGASCSLFFPRPSADCTFSTTLTFTRSLFAVRLPFSHFHQHTGTQRPSPYVTSLPPELLLRCSRRARTCTRTHTSNILRGNVCPGGREQLSAAQWSLLWPTAPLYKLVTFFPFLRLRVSFNHLLLHPLHQFFWLPPCHSTFVFLQASLYSFFSLLLSNGVTRVCRYTLN